MNKFAALFDLDGVLIDTEGVYSDFWDSVNRRFPTGIDNFSQSIKGSTLQRILDNNFAPETHDAIRQMVIDLERDMTYKIYDGVTDMLERLRSAAFAMAIVTSSSDKKMDRLFAQHPALRDYFDVVITDRFVTRSKPDPQGYLMAAEMVKCTPEESFVFEDSLSGLEAGRRSGATVVGLATTNPRDVVKEKADLVVDNFVGLTVVDLLSLKGR